MRTVRRRGYDVEDAEDLVQTFFVRVMDRQSLRLADPDRGRFRSFLLISLKHFLINEYDRARTAKRGGGAAVLSLDFPAGESRYALEPGDALDPERLYEQRWALTVLQRVHVRLRTACMRAGKRELFEQLKAFVGGDDEHVPYREAGAALGMSESAVRVAVHRLRRRFRDLLREEIEQTVDSPADVEGELQFLLTTLLGPVPASTDNALPAVLAPTVRVGIRRQWPLRTRQPGPAGRPLPARGTRRRH